MNFKKLGLAKIFLMIAMPVFSQIKGEYVVEQLNNIHGANWSNLIKRDDDKDKIKNILKEIIEKNNSTPDSYTTQVNAITEFGHFVSIDESGYLLKDEKSLVINAEEFLYNITNNLGPHHKSEVENQMREFWKNTGTLEGFDYLSSNFQSIPNENRSLRYYTLRIMSETLGNDFGKTENSQHSQIKSDTDLYGGVHFRPNLSAKLYERHNSEEWGKRKNELAELIKQFRIDVSKTNPKLLGPVDQLAMQVEKIPTTKDTDPIVLKNGHHDQGGGNISPQKKEMNKKVERSIASRQEEEELEDESPLRIFFLFIVMLFGFFTSLFFFMRKK